MTSTEQSISRRGLIKGAAAVGAGIAAAGVAGKAFADEAQDEQQWDYETEVLVVGLGGAGAVAAVTAHEEGAEVLVIEKAAHTGGGTSSTSGANVCYVVDVDKAFEYVKVGCNGLTPDEVLQAWAEEGESIPDWLEEHGVNWTDGGDAVGFTAISGDDDQIVRVAKLTDPDDSSRAGGNYFMEIMTDLLDEYGVETVFGTRATKLLRDSDGTVIGVQADQDEGTVAIRATKAVVLATGGFDVNDDMMGQYIRPYPLKPAGWPLNTGDGQRMCQAIGADMWHMNMVVGAGYVFDEPDHVIGRTNFKQYVANGAFIFVNRNGERFQAEQPAKYWSHLSTLAYDTFDQNRTQPNTEYRDIPFYCVFDETLRTAGSLFPNNTLRGLACVPSDLGGQDHLWSDDNLEEVEMGWILKGDTLEELAEAINADAADHGFSITGETLEATVERWNELCAAGEDADFERSSSVMVALDNPPYYAMRFMPTICCTCGGPVKNNKGQILDVDGEVIPRLYGAGVLSHAVAHIYSVNGFSWSEVLNGGRIAGRNAAAEEVLA